uniref:Uncharacterized protein n=1 Tax=Ananas comosus var. bracteatus TaxID=296719 RepID=A0A6V7P0L2_ANACO|nr:unnamed protein product [Ananas comosus var. bracteatus]
MQFMSRLYNLDLVSCAQKMKNQAAEALKCYFFTDKPPCFDSTTGFAEILLLDSFFILLMLTCKETFRRAVLTHEPDSSREQENTQFRDDLLRFLDIIMQKDEIMLDC